MSTSDNLFTSGVWQYPAGQGRWWARCSYCGKDLGSWATAQEAKAQLEAHEARAHPGPPARYAITATAHDWVEGYERTSQVPTFYLDGIDTEEGAKRAARRILDPLNKRLALTITAVKV